MNFYSELSIHIVDGIHAISEELQMLLDFLSVLHDEGVLCQQQIKLLLVIQGIHQLSLADIQSLLLQIAVINPVNKNTYDSQNVLLC